MRNNYILLLLMACYTISASAQISPFTDDLEQYSDGEEVCYLPGNGDWWIDWFSDCSSAGEASNLTAHSGLISFRVRPSDAGAGDVVDPVLDLGNKIFGTWSLSFWFYVPLDREAYFNIQGVTPIAGGEWVVGNIFFNQDAQNPGIGLIDDSALGAVNFDYPPQQWFRIYMGWDISGGIDSATWFMEVDGVSVIPCGTAFTDADGTIPTGLGGLNFFSISTDNEYFIDDVSYTDSAFCSLGIDDLNDLGVSIYPNPVSDRLNIQAQEAISSVTIYNIMGQQVYVSDVEAVSTSIDMSLLPQGTYFVEVDIDGKKAVDKIIK
ncbi:MAG: T9SS type A sorting domain-containing protein [Flavobacteriaceae bacterium]|nr:T9SS type A sorting domain-containing protein [Flavobacteriaceae bacterium]